MALLYKASRSLNDSLVDADCPEKMCGPHTQGVDFFGWYDCIAMVRVMTSLLSILGASSIVWMVLASRKLKSIEIHPIFMISLADLFLSLMFLTSSGLWLFKTSPSNYESTSYSSPTNALCVYISLLSAILLLASINLTVVYAVFVFISLKRLSPINDWGWRRRLDDRKWFTVTCYVIAWGLPIVMVLPVFLVQAIGTDLVSVSEKCGCFCKPSIINCMPFGRSGTGARSEYNDKLVKFYTTLIKILIGNYSLGLLLLIILYGLVLWILRKYKKSGGLAHREEDTSLTPQNSSKAHLRICLFLLIFVITGMISFILACIVVNSDHKDQKVLKTHEEYRFLLLLQSLTIGLQGFLNAIVYGWTREDFVSELSLLRSVSSQVNHRSGGASYQRVDFAQFSGSLLDTPFSDTNT